MKPLLLTLVLTAALAAQGPPPLPPPDGPKTVVSGRVLADDGRPVRGVNIGIHAMGGAELAGTVSDGDGRWTVSEAPAGEFFIRAAKSGYVQVGNKILIPAAGKLSGVELRIQRFAVITGRVTDHRGRPVVGARIQVLTEQLLDGETRYSDSPIPNRGRVLTDDRGVYRVWSLTPGRYRIAVSPPRARAADGVIRLDSAPALYPGVATVSEAQPVELAWGSVREGLDVRLPPAANTALKVTMSFEQGPCPRCSLQVVGAASNAALDFAQGFAFSGTYQLEGLPAGDYRLAAHGADERSRMVLQGLAPVRIREGRVETAHVSVARPALLKIRVALDDPPQELLAEDAEPWRASVLLIPHSADRRVLRHSPQMHSGIESTKREALSEIETLPGRWKLHIQPPPSSYVADVSLDGRQLRNGWIEPPPEGFAGELAVRLRFDSGIIEGRLSKTPPPPSAGLQPTPLLVAIAPEPPGVGFWETRPRPVEADGSFAFDVPPGIYRVAVVEQQSFQRLYGDGFSDGEFGDRTNRVEVKAGETVNVTLGPPNE